MRTDYGTQLEMLAGELTEVRAELARAPSLAEQAALRAREISLLRSMRWYRSRMTSRAPQVQRGRIARQRFDAASL